MFGWLVFKFNLTLIDSSRWYWWVSLANSKTPRDCVEDVDDEWAQKGTWTEELVIVPAIDKDNVVLPNIEAVGKKDTKRWVEEFDHKFSIDQLKAFDVILDRAECICERNYIFILIWDTHIKESMGIGLTATALIEKFISRQSKIPQHHQHFTHLCKSTLNIKV